MNRPTASWIPVCAALTAVALSACDGGGVRVSSTRTETTDVKGPLKVVSALQCPQKFGALTRRGSAFAGGAVCSYTGERGSEVSLHLVPLEGEAPATVLKAFEERLSASLPRAAQQVGQSVDAPEAGTSADAEMSIDAQGDKARVRLPGIRIDADGEKASVNIGGLRIRANDSNGQVDVSAPPGGDAVSVRAQGGAVQVRANTPGEATRASWTLIDNRPTEEGWRFVGYEARGPVGGPLVVATTRSRDDDGGRAFDDSKKLVVLNVGQ